MTASLRAGAWLGLSVGACAVVMGCSGATDTARLEGNRGVVPSGGAPLAPGAMTGAGTDGTVVGEDGLPQPAVPAGGGAGVGTGGVGDDGACEVLEAQARLETPDMLIVLDRSGSMSDNGRWSPSVQAVQGVTQNLQSMIRFGLMMFPSPGGSVSAAPGTPSGPTNAADCPTAADPAACCAASPDQINCCFGVADPASCFQSGSGLGGLLGGLGDACAPGQIDVPIAIDNAPAIGSALSGTVAIGGTPTSESLDNAYNELTALLNEPDYIVPAQYVLLVTDGQPTCPAGGGSSLDPATLAQDKAATVASIQRLQSAGIDTYVIGYDTASDAALAGNLDEFAAAGGTGAHRPVENEASLIMELESIAGLAVSCNFQLDNAPGDPSYVRVLLDTQQIDLNDADGWELDGEKTVRLVGGACDRLRSEGTHSVKVTVECEPVAIL